eukprot:221868-Pelagomonas_calceolata.AAC.1
MGGRDVTYCHGVAKVQVSPTLAPITTLEVAPGGVPSTVCAHPIFFTPYRTIKVAHTSPTYASRLLYSLVPGPCAGPCLL